MTRYKASTNKLHEGQFVIVNQSLLTQMPFLAEGTVPSMFLIGHTQRWLKACPYYFGQAS